MSELTANSVVATMRGTKFDCRTAILLLDHSVFGRENELGSMFNVDVINYAYWKLDTVSESQNFLGI